MNYCFLPDGDRPNETRIELAFADLLNALDVPCVVATPDGRAPGQVQASSPILSETEALAGMGKADNAIFSQPRHLAQLRPTAARLIFYCCHTGAGVDTVLADAGVTILAAGSVAAEHISARTGRPSVDIGLSIADAFFMGKRVKAPGSVAFLPHEASLAAACQARNPGLRFVPLDRRTEASAARILGSCEFFLCAGTGEMPWLAVLEAMAAGCVVFAAPASDGLALWRDGCNCRVAAPPDAPAILAETAAPDARLRCARWRDNAVVTASAFRRHRQRDAVSRRLENELSFLRP